MEKMEQLLAEKLLKIYSDPQLAKKMGEEAVRISKKYSIEEVNKSLGEDIEYDEFISITPIHEEEKEAQYPKDLAYNQPNKDVDDIYKEINKESYNKTVDEELDKSFEDVDDDTYKTDAKEYTAEDYKKIEDDMAEEKIREENTKKLLGLSEEKTEKPKDGILRATGPMERKTAPKLDKGQERLVLHK